MSRPQGQTPASFCSNNRSQNRFKNRGHSADRPWTASSRDPHGGRLRLRESRYRVGPAATSRVALHMPYRWATPLALGCPRRNHSSWHYGLLRALSKVRSSTCWPEAAQRSELGPQGHQDRQQHMGVWSHSFSEVSTGESDVSCPKARGLRVSRPQGTSLATEQPWISADPLTSTLCDRAGSLVHPGFL